MKHIFIVNPKAGRASSVDIVKSQLAALGKKDKNIDYEIYPTKCKGDGERFVKQWCEKNSVPIRFYACGGDGTISEVVNGVVPFKHASFSVFPCGSGNDFVKCFAKGEAFLNISDLIYGKEIEIDIIKAGDRYCANVCHFGFDTCVAQTMNRVKPKPLIGGRNAYTTGVAVALIKAMKNNAEIIADGERINNGKFLLCTIANGQYVGGKYKCAPYAEINDGMMDLCLADPVSRLTFIKLVGAYAEGKHLDDPRFSSFLHYKRCRKVEIIADENFKISIDGEITPAPNITVEILPKAVKIALPTVLAESFSEKSSCQKMCKI